MLFNDMYVADNGVTLIGFQTPKYCTIYWLVDGKRKFKTVCYDGDEMAYAINIRTKLTQHLDFEIDYHQESHKQQAV